MKRFHLLAFLTLHLLLSLWNTEALAEKVKIVTFEYPPLFHTSVDGTPSGTVAETILYMCEQVGLDCELEILPFKRAYQKMEMKLADALITIKVGSFESCCTATFWETPWIAGFFSHRSIVDIPKLPDEIIGNRLIVVAGMQSPYEFMPKLDEWEREKKIKLFSANGVYTATKMFLNKRADFLWGSEDFNWYFDKQNVEKTFNFLPLIVRPIVVWVQKDNPELLTRLNSAFWIMEESGLLDHRRLLEPELMSTRYKDAPFNYQ